MTFEAKDSVNLISKSGCPNLIALKISKPYMFLLGFRIKNWLLWRYASRSSLLYSGFRYIIELPLQPYKIQLYTFRVQGLAFFLPWFPDYLWGFPYTEDLIRRMESSRNEILCETLQLPHTLVLIYKKGSERSSVFRSFHSNTQNSKGNIDSLKQ